MYVGYAFLFPADKKMFGVVINLQVLIPTRDPCVSYKEREQLKNNNAWRHPANFFSTSLRNFQRQRNIFQMKSLIIRERREDLLF